MHGVITQFDESKLYGLITISRSTRKIFYSLHNVRLDELGRQFPRARSIGSEVEFTVTAGNRPGRDAAMDVVPFEPFVAEPVDLVAHRELSTVVRLTPSGLGYAKRETGEWISFDAAEVITEGELKIGSQIWHGIKFKSWGGKPFNPNAPLTGPIDPKSVVSCSDIEIVVPTEEPPIPEQEAVVDVAKTEVPTSVLLSDKFRQTPLRKLGIRPRA